LEFTSRQYSSKFASLHSTGNFDGLGLDGQACYFAILLNNVVVNTPTLGLHAILAHSFDDV